MKVFVSWSGGKDAMLALHRAATSGKYDVKFLVNMCDDASGLSRSHGLPSQLIAQQANALDIPLVQPKTSHTNYETVLKTTIANLKNHGVEGGVFGDIYLEPHREWIERVCAESGIAPVFPLWGEPTLLLIEELLALNYQAITVAINHTMIDKSWLGRTIDRPFVDELSALPGIDVCAENGEYHTFVANGPLFSKAVKIIPAGIITDEDHTYFTLNPGSNE